MAGELKIGHLARLLIQISDARSGRCLGKRFCKMFSEGFTVVLKLPCCLSKQGELSKIVYKTSYPGSGPS